MKKISKETWFVIAFTPVVIGVIAFVLLAGEGTETEVKEAKVENTEVNNDPLVQKLFEEDGGLEDPLQQEERLKYYEQENDKYSVGDMSLYDDVETAEKGEDQPKVKPSSTVIKRSTSNSTYKTSSKSEPDQKEVTLQNRQNNFYSSKNSQFSKQAHTAESEFVNAVVHNEHAIKSGGTIRLRITEETKIGDTKIPANTYISGIANFTAERVLITVTSINLSGKLVKTNLNAFDTDGIEGVYVPGGIKEEISQDGVNQTIQQTSVNVPVIGRITTNALSKKANDPVVNIPSGYQILLKKKDL